MQCVGRGSGTDNRCAMLVVVKNGYIHPLAAQFFDHKAIRCFDIFEVNCTEGGFERGDDLGEFFWIGFVHFDVEAIDIGEFLEQDRLALHHRFGGCGADIAQT